MHPASSVIKKKDGPSEKEIEDSMKRLNDLDNAPAPANNTTPLIKIDDPVIKRLNEKYGDSKATEKPDDSDTSVFDDF